MRNVILFALLLLPVSNLSAQWVELGPLPVEQFRAVMFLDDSHGWIGGVDKELYRTTDGGESWELLPALPDEVVNNIYFKSTEEGFLLGSGGNLYRTQDGAASWEKQKVATNRAFWDISFSDDSTGVIVGGDARHESVMLRTTDGGVKWRVLPPYSYDVPVCITHNNEGEFYVGGFRATGIRSTDAGEHWEEVYYGGPLYNGDRPDSESYFNLETNGFNGEFGWYLMVRDWMPDGLLVTSDGGETWELIEYVQQPSYDLYDLYRVSEEDYLLISRGTVYRSANGGDEWVRDPLFDVSSVYHSFQSETESFFLIVKVDGQQSLSLVRYDNTVSIGEEEQTAMPAEFALHGNFPNPFNPSTTIEFSLPETGQVVIDVYDIRGAKVRTLINVHMAAGRRAVEFSGNGLASGTYFYSVQFISETSVMREVGKCLLLK